MTREELKEHCEKQIEMCEMWAISKGENPSGNIYEEHKLILELLEQEPCEDAVNRQAVLNTLDNMDKALDVDRSVENYKELLKECYEVLPSVTPQPTRWIPCSERLPEEEGWYLVTIQNDKTEKRRTENDLFAIGIAEAHKHTPYKFCKDGHRQTVIAWMPLPEPYEESEE